MAFGTAWLPHQGQFSLDDEQYDKLSADYEMRVEYYRGRVEELRGCTLQSWTFNDRPQTRETAVALLGEDEVARQEQVIAGAFWDGTAIAAE